MNQQTGKYFIAIGALAIVIGLILFFFGNKLHWLGKLPGDIRIEKENFRFYFPLATMVLFSILISLLLYLVRRFW